MEGDLQHQQARKKRQESPNSTSLPRLPRARSNTAHLTVIILTFIRVPESAAANHTRHPRRLWLPRRTYHECPLGMYATIGILSAALSGRRDSGLPPVHGSNGSWGSAVGRPVDRKSRSFLWVKGTEKDKEDFSTGRSQWMIFERCCCFLVFFKFILCLQLLTTNTIARWKLDKISLQAGSFCHKNRC